MHDRSHYCKNKLISSAPRATALWQTLYGFCLIILGVAQQAVFAQDVDAFRKGVVKLVATTDGKQKTGTGFIVRHDAQVTYIVTAAHVVEGDKYPKVAFFSQPHSSIEAEVLQNDTRNDISLLKVRDHKQVPPEVSALSFSTSEGVKDNEELIAIGFPAGGGPWAAVRVTLTSRQGLDLTLSGNIDEGNSGGPVLKHDKVIGLVTRTDNFSRATPSEIVTMALKGWSIAIAESEAVEKSRSDDQTTQNNKNKSTSIESKQYDIPAETANQSKSEPVIDVQKMAISESIMVANNRLAPQIKQQLSVAYEASVRAGGFVTVLFPPLTSAVVLQEILDTGAIIQLDTSLSNEFVILLSKSRF